MACVLRHLIVTATWLILVIGKVTQYFNTIRKLMSVNTLTPLETATISTQVFPPFEEERVEVELFKQWIRDNVEDFNNYTEELKHYGWPDKSPPDFVYRSADKSIVMVLELFKAAGVEKTASTLTNVLQEVYKALTPPHPFVEMMASRMTENMELIRKFKDGEDKDKVTEELRRRGFM